MLVNSLCQWNYVGKLLIICLSWCFTSQLTIFHSFGEFETVLIGCFVLLQDKHNSNQGPLDLKVKLYHSPASLCCGPWASHIYPSLVLVKPRKTRPYITERLLMGRKESNQTNKQTKNLPLCYEICCPNNNNNNMSRDMWFPTMWHFDMCRLRRACAPSF